MPYDAALADRLRDLLAVHENVTERKMFGGIGFMVGGNMAIAASSDGGVLVRAHPDDSDTLIASVSDPAGSLHFRMAAKWPRNGSTGITTARAAPTRSAA